jgi:outer membrane receptor protein involved in Fe transport
MSRRSWSFFLLAGGLLFCAAVRPAAAFEGRLLLPDGSPAANYEVNVVGRSIAVPTDADGRFRIEPDPAVPFILIATSPGESLSAPIEVAALPAGGGLLELSIPVTFRDSITVASGVAPNITAPPAAATVVIGREDLEQRRPQRLSDTIEAVAGASRSDEGPTGVPTLRGLARGRTLVLLDGSRVATERRAGASATFLDPFSLASVEVSRGPGSVAYGSDAFGGVIHARSRFPEPGDPSVRFEVNGDLGAGDEQSAGLEASTDLLGGAILGSFHIRRAGEYEAGGGDTVPVSSYRDRGGALRYTADTNLGRLRIGLAADRAYDVQRPAADSDVTRTIYPLETSDRLTVGLAARPGGGWESLDVDLYVGRYRLVLDRDRVATPTSVRTIETSDNDGNDASLRGVAARPAAGGRLQIGAEVVSRFGLEALTEVERFNPAGDTSTVATTVSIEDAERRDLGLFATWDRPVASRALVSVGLRGDRVDSENSGGFFGDRSASHEALSGHLGLVVGPFADWTASLQVARGFRDPTLSDRYFRGPSGRGFVVGNPDLDPETSLQYDGSLRWEKSGRSVAVYGYFYEIKDLIERFRPANDFFFRNRGEAEIRGVEVEAQAPLGANFSLQVAAAIARGEAEDGAPIDDIAADGGWVTLRWANARGFAYLRTAAFLDDDRPGPTELERPSFTTVDLGAGWRITELLEVRAVGRNLTDRKYIPVGDESATFGRGRTVTLGLIARR